MIAKAFIGSSRSPLGETWTAYRPDFSVIGTYSGPDARTHAVNAAKEYNLLHGIVTCGFKQFCLAQI